MISLLGTCLAWPFVDCFPHGLPAQEERCHHNWPDVKGSQDRWAFLRPVWPWGQIREGRPRRGGPQPGPSCPVVLGSMRSPLTPFSLTCLLFSYLDVQPVFPPGPIHLPRATPMSSWSVLSSSPAGGHTLAASPTTTSMPPLFLMQFILDIAN